uniref:Uncharacterized protein n=1 Tax=Oryzias latipes TaxID=8090 RepID=A0A3P9HS78_ORYLA
MRFWRCGLFSLYKAASSCETIEVEMCQGLSYNLTSFPNIWLSIADQREAATLLRQYRVQKNPIFPPQRSFGGRPLNLCLLC